MSASIWAPGNELVTVDAESTNLSQVFTATDSQVVFNLTLFSYAVGTGSIAVYRGGQRLILGTDWAETSSTSISLTGFSIAAGEIIEVVAVLGSASSASIAAQAAAATAVAAAASVSASILPNQAGQSGQFLTTNGTVTDWVAIDTLPSQAGNSGKYLTTNGTVANWEAITSVTLNGVETLTNKTLTTPNINTSFNFTGSSGKIQVGGVDKVTIGTSGIESGSYKAGSIRPVDTQVGALPSVVRLNTANGYGSTNTQIRRFTNTVLNQGTDITYADSATLGASFTINTTGVYAISYFDTYSNTASFGISLNSSQLSTGVAAINVSDLLAIGTNAFNGFGMTVTTTVFLTAGSVIRPHGTSAGISSGTQQGFTIQRVA